MRILNALSVILLAAAFGIICYVSDQNNKSNGAVQDANEYLVTHGMIQNLPAYCVYRPAGYFICKANETGHLRCSARSFLASNTSSNRCTFTPNH